MVETNVPTQEQHQFLVRKHKGSISPRLLGFEQKKIEKEEKERSSRGSLVG